MADDPTQPHYSDAIGHDDPIQATRMSFGDHLEELRRCLVRSLIGVALAGVLTLSFGRQILQIIFRPLWTVQFANGLQPNLQVLAPTDAFTAYLKVSALSALILAMPWVLHQMWHFVAAGLYFRERRFVKSLVWSSSGLFVVGVLFLYYLVLPLVLQFFITFNRAFGVADLSPSALQRVLLPERTLSAETTGTSAYMQLPVRREDPPDAKPGEPWVNAATRRLMLKTNEGVWSIPFESGPTSPAMQSQFAVDQYISFVLLLSLAFGIAFETPIVVCFLAWTGLVSTATMAQGRRYVVLGTAVASAVMTPTADILNQMLLAVPMYVLFEAGLWIARRMERRKTAQAGATG
jgi:Tat protein translocase TatC